MTTATGEDLGGRIGRAAGLAVTVRNGADPGTDPGTVPVPAALVLPEADDEPHFAATLGMFIAHAIDALAELEATIRAVEASDGAASTLAGGRRILHRLNADFGLLHMPAPQQLCREVEATIDACVGPGSAFPVDAMLQGVDLLKQFLDRLARDAKAPFGEVEPLLQKLRDLADATPAANPSATDSAARLELQVGGDFADRLPEFVTAARRHLAEAEAAMVALATTPADLELIHLTFRAFHTIQGIAGFLNLQPLVELAHGAAALLERAHTQPSHFGAEHVELVLAAADMSRQMLSALEGRPAPEQRLRTRLVARLAAATRVAAPAEAPAASVAKGTVPVAGTTETPDGFVPGQFLSFRLSDDEYGIAIRKVREILGMVEVMPLPGAPDFVLGVVNWRGRSLPVIDLRRRLGMGPIEPGRQSCIVVVEVGRDADSVLRVGCLVDAVGEVLSIGVEHFEATPRGANAAGDCIAGSAQVQDRLLMLLDIERVLAAIEPTALATATSGAGSGTGG